MHLHNKKIAFIGGDSRQLTAALEFAGSGFEVVLFGFDKYPEINEPLYIGLTLEAAIRGAFLIILPLPSFIDSRRLNAPLSGEAILREEILTLLEPEQRVFGGMLDNDFINAHPDSVDYYEREELKILNAIPTAEGAVAVAMEEMPITLHGSKSVVLGYGRIGKILANMLKSLGATVTVCARKESDLAFCEAYGFKTEYTKNVKNAVKNTDVVFNTIPEKILNGGILKNLDKNTLIIDLAARPGGVDFDAARDLGINAVWALSLPGKTAPVTAGKIIYRTVQNILTSEGNI